MLNENNVFVFKEFFEILMYVIFVDSGFVLKEVIDELDVLFVFLIENLIDYIVVF